MNSILIQTRNLSKRYGSLLAVNDLNLDIYAGEVFGILGPNGAGKTTAIHMLCGLLKPDAGQVLLNEQPLNDRHNWQARLGGCPQEIVVWEKLTCLEQLQFMGEMHGLSGRRARQRGLDLLKILDLGERASWQAAKLSGGMRRRLSLALALVHDPEIVVLDEPEAGLDPQSRLLVREFIQSLAHQKTVILTTHNMDECERLADRVAIIDHGCLLVLDTPDALKRRLGKGDIIEINLGCAVPQDIEARLSGQVNPGELSADGNLLVLRMLNGVHRLPALLEALAQAGQEASDVRLRQNSLEDVFIQLTGRKLRQ
jgi:ABC-2 type transport system ATP-binding protein